MTTTTPAPTTLTPALRRCILAQPMPNYAPTIRALAQHAGVPFATMRQWVLQTLDERAEHGKPADRSGMHAALEREMTRRTYEREIGQEFVSRVEPEDLDALRAQSAHDAGLTYNAVAVAVDVATPTAETRKARKRRSARETYAPQVCERAACGKTFTPSYATSQSRRQRFCSRSCAQKERQRLGHTLPIGTLLPRAHEAGIPASEKGAQLPSQPQTTTPITTTATTTEPDTRDALTPIAFARDDGSLLLAPDLATTLREKIRALVREVAADVLREVAEPIARDLLARVLGETVRVAD